ncbi:PBSX family phage terminase large subunit [Bacillus sp. J33]|uniref:PBSX family phage terminase large subunit n=1 Tax=Bacillus sp. J33 TaxID=935836 RepID=UPI00047D1798|nr:PBSX family phage terminase large subunit [Bacillus sp. J33]
MTVKTINVMDLMNVNFYPLWLADQSHIVAKGGRSSMKSSVISLKLVVDFLEDDLGNVVCLRKVGKYLSTSIYEQITYLDDKKGFLSEQMIRKIEKYKENDEDYWRWMYAGEVIGLGDMVYNMAHFKEIDKLPKDDDLILIDIAIDTGHQVSATTFLAFGFTKKRNVILLDTFYYSPENKVLKKAPSELSKDLKEWMDKIQQTYKRHLDMQTIDSAEGALRNQFFKDYGIRLHPVVKKKKIDMIDNVQDLLAQGRFFVLKKAANEVFLTEHKKYQWDADTLQSDDPKVIKIDDHTCDAFQYYVQDNLRKLGLKY